MSILQNILPSHTPEKIQNQDNLAILRERVLQTLYLATFLIGITVVPLFTIENIRQNYARGTFFLALIFIPFVALTFLRRIQYRWRALGYIAFLYLLGFELMVEIGNSGDSFLLLLTFILITSVLLGIRAGVIAFFLSLATTIFISVGMVNGSIAPIYDVIDSSNGSSWGRTGAIFTLSSGAVIASIVVVVSGLQNALERTQLLSNTLEKERASLEKIVIQKTRNLERRLVELRTAADISRSTSSILDSQQLIQKAADLLKNRLDLYYVGVFLLDDTNQYAELKAGTGEAGQKMIAERHRLLVGGISMIGWATANRKARIALDVGSEGMRFNNPHLPLTRSELALPITGRSKVLGAISIQSVYPNAFDEDDIQILQGVADGLAIGLENAQLFEQNQRDLVEISTLNQQYVKQSWSEEVSSSGQLDYVYENESADIGSETTNNIQIPIKLRDQTIGFFEVERDLNQFSDDEIEFLQSVTSQTAIALENARLLQESQRRAAQEERTAELTSKFSQAFKIDDILKIAVKELGQIPAVSEVAIHLSNIEDDQEANPHLNGNNGNEEHAA